MPLEAYTGKFEHNYFGEHILSTEDGHLTVWFAPRNTGDLQHWQGDTFFLHWREDPLDGGFLTFSIIDVQVDGFTIEKESVFKKVGN